MPKVSVKVDGLMLLVGLAVSGGVYVYLNRQELLNKVNPASSENIVNQTVTNAVGAENLATAGDYVFGAVDLINPFNDSDDYAVQVYGGSPFLNWLDRDILPGVPLI